MAQPGPLPAADRSSDKRLVVRLYIAGAAPNSTRAVDNLKALCNAHFADGCTVEIIDVLKEPLRALNDDILVTPTLIKLAPGPHMRIIGDLSDATRVLSALSDSVST